METPCPIIAPAMIQSEIKLTENWDKNLRQQEMRKSQWSQRIIMSSQHQCGLPDLFSIICLLSPARMQLASSVCLGTISSWASVLHTSASTGAFFLSSRFKTAITKNQTNKNPEDCFILTHSRARLQIFVSPGNGLASHNLTWSSNALLLWIYTHWHKQWLNNNDNKNNN